MSKKEVRLGDCFIHVQSFGKDGVAFKVTSSKQLTHGFSEIIANEDAIQLAICLLEAVQDDKERILVTRQ